MLRRAVLCSVRRRTSERLGSRGLFSQTHRRPHRMPTETISAVLAPGRGAVITGGASGIGLATARRLAALGMRVCIADLDRNALHSAAKDLSGLVRGGARDVLTVEADVSSTSDVDRLAETAFGSFGDVALLMNNA